MSYGVAAYLLWGLFPLYWPLLEPAGAVEILAHRIVWSLVVVLGILAVTAQLVVAAAVAARPARRLVAGARRRPHRRQLVHLHLGVNNEHVVETSLGYFINPLVTVLLGVLVLSERLRTTQWVAVGLGRSPSSCWPSTTGGRRGSRSGSPSRSRPTAC